MTFGSALLLLGSLLPPTLQAPTPPPMTVEKVADDFHVVMGGGAGNTTIYITDEGLVLVDPKFERSHAELVARVSAISPRPIKGWGDAGDRKGGRYDPFVKPHSAPGCRSMAPSS